mmetsp:Transcript_93084/g.216329  ORF Transcript_93084/g.216329 Transcript_93084/m.216329 type:complete len:221 (+) Transcript_93084:327-989(+)
MTSRRKDASARSLTHAPNISTASGAGPTPAKATLQAIHAWLRVHSHRCEGLCEGLPLACGVKLSNCCQCDEVVEAPSKHGTHGLATEGHQYEGATVRKPEHQKDAVEACDEEEWHEAAQAATAGTSTLSKRTAGQARVTCNEPRIITQQEDAANPTQELVEGHVTRGQASDSCHKDTDDTEPDLPELGLHFRGQGPSRWHAHGQRQHVYRSSAARPASVQ